VKCRLKANHRRDHPLEGREVDGSLQRSLDDFQILISAEAIFSLRSRPPFSYADIDRLQRLLLTSNHLVPVFYSISFPHITPFFFPSDSFSTLSVLTQLNRTSTTDEHRSYYPISTQSCRDSVLEKPF